MIIIVEQEKYHLHLSIIVYKNIFFIFYICILFIACHIYSRLFMLLLLYIYIYYLNVFYKTNKTLNIFLWNTLSESSG